MKRIFILLPAVLLLGLCSCNDPFGDVLCNGSGKKIRILATTGEGRVDEYVIKKGDYGTGVRKYKTIEVFDMRGRLIGAYTRTDLPAEPGRYVAPMWVLAAPGGVFPIPDEYRLDWKSRIPEIVRAAAR